MVQISLPRINTSTRNMVDALENLKLIEIWPRQFFKLETVLELVVLLVLLVLSGELRVSDEGPNWRLLHLTKHFSVNLTCQ